MSLGNETQRLERSRAFVVVFQQEAIDGQRAEQLLRDRVIAAFGVPVAAIVSAAKMNCQRNARPTGRIEACVVGANRFVNMPPDRRCISVSIHWRHFGSRK